MARNTKDEFFKFILLYTTTLNDQQRNNLTEVPNDMLACIVTKYMIFHIFGCVKNIANQKHNENNCAFSDTNM